eukprot:COSAG06_NODE_2703_length_6428_cov_16.204743_2_plen_31_part_00
MITQIVTHVVKHNHTINIKAASKLLISAFI